MGSFISFLKSKKQKSLLDLYEDEVHFESEREIRRREEIDAGKKPLLLRQYSLYEHIYD